MKKVIIFAIILINILSIYFWNFPYISEADLKTYRLTERALQKQNEIIGTSTDVNIRAIDKFVRKDSTWNHYLESAIAIHGFNKIIYTDFQQLRDLMFENLSQDFAFKWQTGDTSIYNLRSRLQPIHYSVPNKFLFQNDGLSSISKSIQIQQELILNQIENNSFRQVVKDNMLINTEAFVQEFENVYLQKALTLLSRFQNQVKILDYQILSFFVSEINREENKQNALYQSFLPIIHTKTPIVRKGEYFEAKVFAATYVKNSSIKISVNGKEIPVENGIGIYEVQTATTGRKRIIVHIAMTNPLTRKTESYKKEFIYEVISKE